MATRLSEETTKIHCHIYTKDLERIDKYFCKPGLRTVGRSKAIRMMLHAVLNSLEKKADAKPIQFDPGILDLIDE